MQNTTQGSGGKNAGGAGDCFVLFERFQRTSMKKISQDFHFSRTFLPFESLKPINLVTNL